MLYHSRSSLSKSHNCLSEYCINPIFASRNIGVTKLTLPVPETRQQCQRVEPVIRTSSGVEKNVLITGVPITDIHCNPIILTSAEN